MIEQIATEDEKEKLQAKISDLERRARKETQSKKKFELFQELKECQKRLEEMR